MRKRRTRSTPNAYGGTILAVRPLEHPKGLRWIEVTWEFDGKRHTAKTFPGSDANQQVAEYDLTKPAQIILNDRSQIVFVEPQLGICPNCASAHLRWSLHKQVSHQAPLDGRLQMHDVQIVAVLGCEECSETVQTIDQTMAEEMLNA